MSLPFTGWRQISPTKIRRLRIEARLPNRCRRKSELATVFGNDHVYRNVNVFNKGSRIGEIDVLVLFADRAVVVQCKSKKLTIEARKGNDLRLLDDFKKSVQDAYDQAYLCSKSLSDPELEFSW